MQNQHRARFRAFLPPLLVFIGSRIVAALAIIYSVYYVEPHTEGVWNVDSPWLRYLLRWDAGWYLKIAREGYSYDGNDTVEHPVVFPPLYPLISKGVALLTGAPEYVGLIVVSNVAILVAVPLLYKLIREDYGDEVALYAVALLSFFPASLFFSAGYTESLTLLLVVGFFLFLKGGRFLPASLCAGLALATRSSSIVLLLPLLWEVWRRYRKEPPRLLLRAALSMVLATSGLWLYMLYLWAAFKSPLAFMTAQRAWHEGGVGSHFASLLTLRPFREHLWDITRGGPVVYALDPWFFLLFAVLLLLFVRRLRTSHALYALGVLALPYVTKSGSTGFISFTRYIMLAFPVFVLMGSLLKGKPWAVAGITLVFAAMLFCYTALFAQWYWAG